MEPIENPTPEPKKFEVSMPVAILVAGVLIAGAIVGTSYAKKPTTVEKEPTSLAEKVGIDDKKLQACMKAEGGKQAVEAGIASGEKAMGHLPLNQRGTPYSVALAKDGTKVQIQGNQSYAYVKSVVDALLGGSAESQTEINLDPITDTDHIWGNKDADIVIVEYTDFECPFCYNFRPTLERIMSEYSGKVAVVYRNYPLSIHENAYVKAEAAECAAQQGNDAYWKYANGLFDLQKPQETNSFDTSTL